MPPEIQCQHPRRTGRRHAAPVGRHIYCYHDLPHHSEHASLFQEAAHLAVSYGPVVGPTRSRPRSLDVIGSPDVNSKLLISNVFERVFDIRVRSSPLLCFEPKFGNSPEHQTGLRSPLEYRRWERDILISVNARYSCPILSFNARVINEINTGAIERALKPYDFL